ncbi:MAG: cell division protein ZipA [Cellvibrionaceae bacterium]
MDQYWLTIIIVLLIVGIVFDGIRRMRNAKRDSLKMSLRPVNRDADDVLDEDKDYGSEFPNGGARVSDRQIDPERIKQVRSKYNFGSDIPAWRDKVADKIAEHTGMKKADEKEASQASSRIEPSFDHEVDPLLDNVDDDRVLEEELSVTESVTSTYESAYETSAYENSSTEASYLQENQIEEDVDYDTHLDQPEIDLNEDVVPEAAEVMLEQEALVQEPASREPVQTSLNLEDSVPMLMDSLEGNESGASDMQEIRTVAINIEANAEDADGAIETHSANKPRYESKYVDHAKQTVEHKKQSQQKNKQADSEQKNNQKEKELQDVLVIHVKAAKDEYFYGSDLLDLILENGMRYGEMNIFHRHADEDGEGPILFSMANMVKPGIFDLHTFEEFSTVGLSFFLPLPTELNNNMEAFDVMLATAKDIADKLSGELNDEQRSVLTGQTIEHYRERIRDFTRRQQLEKNKP